MSVKLDPPRLSIVPFIVVSFISNIRTLFGTRVNDKSFMIETVFNTIGHFMRCSGRYLILVPASFLQDFPRWGDYPEKLRLDYLASLVRTGKKNLATWFHL